MLMGDVRTTSGGNARRSILVVDDEPGIRKVLVDWIRGLGHEPYEAEDAESAVNILRATHIHVALVDILMPGRDGIWLIKQMQQKFADTSVIIVSGLTAMDPAVTLSPGVVGYLVKPFDFDDITRMIDVAIASRERMPAPRLPLRALALSSGNELR